jgi:Cof subfamily protein (haloacid dehalogenase superfamily)
MESVRSETSPPRALFFDLDGTLLDSRKTVSPLTLAALKRLNAAGIGTYAATARPPHIDRQLGLAAMGAEFLLQGVFMNGAVTRIHDRCEYAFIEPGAVEEAIAIARTVEGLNVALQMPGNVHAFLHPLPPEEYRLWGLRGILSGEIIPFPPRKAPLPDEIAKIVFFSVGNWLIEGRDLSDFHRALVKALGGRATVYISDAGKVVQAVGRGVSKRFGIQAAMRRLHLAPGEIAVFGDDINDVEMLSSFPRSYAMGNGIAEAKAAAEFVIGGNDEEGIAIALAGLYPGILN